ncbi:MAG: glucose 1-dehydrogenase [Myxococcota bacterium]|nr:glucose 1-dehydrogenase [Myxococcales bacterium]
MTAPGRLAGRVALVTGAARGMGRAEAELFAAEGAKVVVADVLEDEAKTVAAGIGAAALALRLDVTSEAAWSDAVAATTDAFGRLDVLVNNAGVADAAPLAETTLESYRRVTEVNQTGVFLGMRAAVAPMRAAGGGSILNVSSIDGMIGMDLCTPYVASKWAVRGMTKVAARELGPLGIRVNSIHPGFIRTHMGTPEGGDTAVTHAALERYADDLVPLGRAGRPEDVARLALFLASDESAYCTGAEFVVDGGMISGYPPPGLSGPIR